MSAKTSFLPILSSLLVTRMSKKIWLHTNIFRTESKVGLLKSILAVLKDICKQPKLNIKFIYSEKATEFENKCLSMSEIRERFFQMSAAFSKNINLIKSEYKYFFKSHVIVKKRGQLILFTQT